MKPIARNKKAFFDYQILEDWEAGLVLLGSEIKAVRAGRINISGSYIRPLTHEGKTELWWIGSHFNLTEGDQTRTKKILLHQQEVSRLLGKLTTGELTILPLELYIKRGLAKLKIGLAKRKKQHDKREILKKEAELRSVRHQLQRRR